MHTNEDYNDDLDQHIDQLEGQYDEEVVDGTI